jgi:hypothetical protein
MVRMPEGAHLLGIGEEVAIMPLGATAPAEILEISKVSYVRSSTIQLENGRLYKRADGRGLVSNDYIVLATEDHRQEMLRRKTPSDDSIH